MEILQSGQTGVPGQQLVEMRLVHEREHVLTPLLIMEEGIVMILDCFRKQKNVTWDLAEVLALHNPIIFYFFKQILFFNNLNYAFKKNDGLL